MSEEEKLPDILYHYTDLNAFKSIIENKELWASNVLYLNDHSEGKFFGKAIIEEIEKKIPISDIQCKEISQYITNISNWKNLPLQDIYTVSFCENGDLLNQWLAYGNGTGGISLGFEKKILRKLSRNLEEQLGKNLICFTTSVKLKKVLYGIREGEKIKIPFLKSFIEKIKKNEELDQYIFSILVFAEYIFFCKDPAFKNEKEWRITIKQNSDDLKNIDFRQKGDFFLPYFKFKLFEIGDETVKIPLKEIILGPSNYQELNRRSIIQFLVKQGFIVFYIIRVTQKHRELSLSVCDELRERKKEINDAIWIYNIKGIDVRKEIYSTYGGQIEKDPLKQEILKDYPNAVEIKLSETPYRG